MKRKSKFASVLLLGVSALLGVLILIKVAGFVRTLAGAEDTVRKAIAYGKSDGNGLKEDTVKSKALADELKRRNLFAPAALKQSASSVDTPTLALIELPLQRDGEPLLPDTPEAKEKVKKNREPDVIFVPTPQDVVDKMLELVKVQKDDLIYDLGCGDGRIVVTAAQKYGCRAVGYDIDPQRVKESLENVDANNVGHLVRIEQKDIFTLDLSDANVITLYLLPSLNVKLIPQLEKLKPGSRIVSHDFRMRGVKPDKVVKLTSSEDKAQHKIFLWTSPLKKRKKKKQARADAGSREEIGILISEILSEPQMNTGFRIKISDEY